MGLQDSWWNISVTSLVIVAASVFEISCGKTDRQTDRQINTAENHIYSTTVGVSNERKLQRSIILLTAHIVEVTGNAKYNNCIYCGMARLKTDFEHGNNILFFAVLITRCRQCRFYTMFWRGNLYLSLVCICVRNYYSKANGRVSDNVICCSSAVDNTGLVSSCCRMLHRHSHWMVRWRRGRLPQRHLRVRTQGRDEDRRSRPRHLPYRPARGRVGL